jgi:tetratricopeptide (TPR) repeat protein
MYGAIDGVVKFTPEQKKANEWFIEEIIRDYGSKDKGSEVAAKEGWYHLSKHNPRMAMKRFNQAWLLNPNNSNAYWGFGILMSGYGKDDKAIEMFEKALSLAPDNMKLLGDVANSYVEKAKKMTDDSNKQQSILFEKANALFLKAEDMNPDRCIYAQWAVLSYDQGNYSLCLDKIKKAYSSPDKTRACKFIEEYEKKCKAALRQ